MNDLIFAIHKQWRPATFEWGLWAVGTNACYLMDVITYEAYCFYGKDIISSIFKEWRKVDSGCQFTGGF